MATKLIVGCGYLGSRVGRRWLDSGHEVAVVTRSPQRAERLRQQGFRPLVADVTQVATLSSLPEADTVLYAVGHGVAAAESLRAVYVDGLSNVLDALPPATGRLVYISSTGVYGDAGGDWVDEDTPCHPQRPAGKACLAAEEALEAHRLGRRSIVLRLAGIYGPGRVGRDKELLAGEPIAVPRHGYLNLIHVDDAVAVILAAEDRAEPPRRYLVSDGHPVQRRRYYAELARVLGAAPPSFVEPSTLSAAPGRAVANKRVSNRRLLAELNVTLRYPSPRQGLAASVATGS